MTGLKSRLLLISGFIILYLLRLDSVSRNQIKIPIGARVKVIARISEQPTLNTSNQIITLGSFLVKTSRLPGYFYGQKLEVVGRPATGLTKSGRDGFIFDYPSIRVIPDQESLINQTQAGRFIFSIRGRLENQFLRVLPVSQSGLMSGILLGVKSQLPQNFLQNLRKTGTIHIVVASGYNLSVIAGLLLAAFTNFISRRKAVFFAILGVWSYALLAGWQPAVLRAAIMVSLTFLAQIFGREKDGGLGLLFAGVMMLLLSPLILFDIGFQLSFLATAGILLLGPVLKGRLFRLPVIGEELQVTLAAQLAVLPILLANFGEINFLSPLINILILPVVPLVMVLGLLFLSLALVSRLMALVIAWLAWLPLTYMVSLINWFAERNLGLFWVGKIPFSLIIIYYLILGIWIRNSKQSFSA